MRLNHWWDFFLSVDFSVRESSKGVKYFIFPMYTTNLSLSRIGECFQMSLLFFDVFGLVAVLRRCPWCWMVRWNRWGNWSLCKGNTRIWRIRQTSGYLDSTTKTTALHPKRPKPWFLSPVPLQRPYFSPFVYVAQKQADFSDASAVNQWQLRVGVVILASPSHVMDVLANWWA